MPNIIILANENGRFRHTTRTANVENTHSVFNLLTSKTNPWDLGTSSVHIYLGVEFV